MMYRVKKRIEEKYKRKEEMRIINELKEKLKEEVDEKKEIGMIDKNEDFKEEIEDEGRNEYFKGMLNRMMDEGSRIMRI